MRRKSRRAPIHLDAKGLSDLPKADLHAVLRGADDLIGQGGRTLLKRLLRGSKNKDILARGLEKREAKLDAGEFLEVLTPSFDEVLAMLRDGRITDAKTVAGLLWVQAFAG